MRRAPCLISGAALALLLAAARPARAETYQVGPTRMYPGLEAVAGLLEPGDVVEVDGDVTYPGDVIFDRPGAPEAPITIRGVRVNGKRPVVSGGVNTIEARADHYVFEGLDITAGEFRCFYHHAHDVVLRDAVVHGCAQHGILGADTDSGTLVLEHSEVFGNGEGTQHHQIYMATDESAHPGSVFRMQHCYVHDANGGNSVKSRAERNEIYANWIEGALYHELELIGPDGQDPDLAREDSDVVGNVLVKRNDGSFVVRFGGDGTGETEGRYRFVGNTVVVQPGGLAVFRLFDGLESVEMHNNIFVAADGGPVDLVREAEAAWATGARLVGGSNNWVSEGSTTVPPEWTGTLTGPDPGFLDPDNLDLRLREGSPLIDAGGPAESALSGHEIPLPLAAPAWEPPVHAAEEPGASVARPVVGAIDVGAYEFGPHGGTGGGGGGGSGGGSSGAGAGSSGAGASGSTGGNGVLSSGEDAGEEGCACRAAPRPSAGGMAAAAGLGALAILRRRRRRAA